MYMYTLYETHPGKICHRGLRPGLIQDGLYSHKKIAARQVEAWKSDMLAR